jgi:hypothetical protein
VAGALLFFRRARGLSSFERQTSTQNLQSLFGAGLIFAAVFFWLHKGTPYPGWAALLPIVATLLILNSEKAWLNRAVLAARPMVNVGLISYPLYLWHWPILSFARIIEFGTPSVGTRVAIVLASVVLATLTYHFIEKPIRFGQNRKVKTFAVSFAMVLIGCIGLATIAGNGFYFRLSAEIQAILTAEKTSRDIAQWRPSKCFLSPSQTKSDFVDECTGGDRRPLVFLWGDSYAAALYPGLKNLAASHNFGLAQYTSSCGPVVSYNRTDTPRTECKDLTDFVVSKIRELRPDIVILHARWPDYDIPRIEPTVAELHKLGVRRIVMVGPVPNWKGGLSPTILQYFRENAVDRILPDRTRYHLIGDDLERSICNIAVSLGIEYLSTWNVLCNQDGCLTRISGKLSALDEMHLSVAASIFVASALAPAILEQSARP